MREEYRFKLSTANYFALTPRLANFSTKMKKNQTISLNAQMVISKTESGLDVIQVLPDDPSDGLVKPFSGAGHAQLQGNAQFDFVRKRRIRGKAELKQPHSTLSYGRDGIDRYIFYLPSGQRDEFAELLMKEAAVAVAYMKNKR